MKSNYTLDVNQKAYQLEKRKVTPLLPKSTRKLLRKK